MTVLNQQYRITAHMMLFGLIDIENVYYLRVVTAGTDTDGDVLDASAAWLDTAYSNIAVYLTNQLQFVDVRGFNITTDTPIAPVAWPALINGSSTSGDPIASGVSAIVTFYTAASKVRGRKFLGGLIENVVVNSLMTSQWLSAAVSFGIDIFAGPSILTGGTNVQWGIRSKNGTFHTVLRFVAQAIPGYQRRRRQGVGA